VFDEVTLGDTELLAVTEREEDRVADVVPVVDRVLLRDSDLVIVGIPDDERVIVPVFETSCVGVAV